MISWRLAFGIFLICSVGSRTCAQPCDAEPTRRAAQAGAYPAAFDLLARSDGRDGLDSSHYPNQSVRGQPAHLGYANYLLKVPIPVWSDDKQGFVADVLLQNLAVRTNAILPDDRVRFPNHFTEVQLGGTYYKLLANGWSFAASLSAGSASDRPFQSTREMVYYSSGFLRVPTGERNAWLFTIFLETNSQAGGNYPIPGVGYEFNPSDTFSGVLGLPFSYLTLTPKKGWNLDVSYHLLTNVRAQSTVAIKDKLKWYTAAVWHNQSWLRADRSNSNDLFNWFEKRLETGLLWSIHPNARAELIGGYAFNRYFVENQGFSLGGRNRVDVQNSVYLSFRVSLMY